MSSEYFSRNIPLESTSSRSPPAVASALTNLPQASVASFQESFIPFQELTAISAEFFGSPQYRFGAWRTTGRKRLRDFDDDGLNAGNRAGKRRRGGSAVWIGGIWIGDVSGLGASGLETSGLERSGLVPCEILTKENLRKLVSQFDKLDKIDEPHTKGVKRSQSQKSMTQASDVYSQKSSLTAGNYRLNIIDPARLSVDIDPSQRRNSRQQEASPSSNCQGLC